MPSPQTMRRNGDAPVGTPSSSPRPRLPPPVPLTATPSPHHHHHQGFYSTVALQKLRRLNFLILVFRFLTFICSLTSFVFMLTNSNSGSGSQSLRWLDFDAFRFVLSAGAIAALYSLFEMVASIWEITTSSTLFAEFFQVWFDFANDQVLAYVLLSAESAGTELAKALRRTDTCSSDTAFCLQSDISVGLGLLAFVFLALSSLFSGFRLVSFIVNGSRFQF